MKNEGVLRTANFLSALLVLPMLLLGLLIATSRLYAKDKEQIITEALKALENSQNAERALNTVASPLNAVGEPDFSIEGSRVELETRVFTLSHATALDLKTEVDALLNEGTGTAVYDRAPNEITVTDTPNNLEVIAEKIAGLDRRTEIAFVGQVVEIRLNEEHQKGVDWQAIVSNFQPIELRLPASSQGPAARLSFGTISQEDFKILLDALQSVGELETISQPSVTVMPHQEAGVPLAMTKPFELVLDAAGSNPAANPAAAGPFQTYFLGLSLTPQRPVHNSLGLTLTPRFHWSADKGIVTASLIETTIARTDILVIGGLFQTREASVETRAPVIGNLPVVGSFFRGRRNYTAKTEFVVFLTPKIMVEGKEAVLPGN